MTVTQWIALGCALLAVLLFALAVLLARRIAELTADGRRLHAQNAHLAQENNRFRAEITGLQQRLRAVTAAAAGGAPDRAAYQAELDRQFAQLKQFQLDLERELADARRERDAALAELARLRSAPEPSPAPPGAMPPLATAGPSGPADAAAGQIPAALDPVPDTEVDAGDQGGFLIRAASLRGPRHRRAAVPRKDAFLLRSFDGRFRRPFTLAVVAAGDPAGAWAQLAARTTCLSLATQLGSQARTLEEVLRDGGGEELLGELLHTVVEGTAESLTHLARSRNAAPAAAATDFVAVLSPMGDMPVRRHLVFGTGPCAVSRLRGGAWQTVFTPAAPAAPAAPGGSPPARTPEAASAALRHGVVDTEQGDVLAVCGPSVAELLHDGDVQEFLARQWSDGAPHLPEFLWQLGVAVRGATADRTAVCLWEFGRVADVRLSAPSRAAWSEPAPAGG
ncbi:hypothetical protein RKE29_11245 [Streptomyces sp. B1866]|uniref:hypothetical protein n=1 Tax=Streptomyces sp. B1866 TaxID=3075431 RepID=UPI00289030CC|nr:hypothetical protein [Streptomyces sp. B1866]MDT3397213.1 hypothetical protein [Streptomyces sp. B1866]